MTIKELGELLVSQPDGEKYSVKCFTFDRFNYDHGAIRGDEISIILQDINNESVYGFDRKPVEYAIVIRLGEGHEEN